MVQAAALPNTLQAEPRVEGAHAEAGHDDDLEGDHDPQAQPRPEGVLP